MNPEGDVAARTRAFARAWFPVAREVDLGSPVLATLLGARLVVFRTASGETVVLRNRCPHRGGALNLGQVVGDGIQCPYHGWRFGADGSCTAKNAQEAHFLMNAQKLGRLALITATSGFMVGVALLNGGSSNAIGGL